MFLKRPFGPLDGGRMALASADPTYMIETAYYIYTSAMGAWTKREKGSARVCFTLKI